MLPLPHEYRSRVEYAGGEGADEILDRGELARSIVVEDFDHVKGQPCRRQTFNTAPQRGGSAGPIRANIA